MIAMIFGYNICFGHAAMTSEEPEKRIYKLLSFDVYGTLMDTPRVSAKAFGRILADAGASNVEVNAQSNPLRATDGQPAVEGRMATRSRA